MSDLTHISYDPEDPGAREYIAYPPSPLSVTSFSPQNKPLRWITVHPSSLEQDNVDELEPDDDETEISPSESPFVIAGNGKATKEEKNEKKSIGRKKQRREAEVVNGFDDQATPTTAASAIADGGASKSTLSPFTKLSSEGDARGLKTTMNGARKGPVQLNGDEGTESIAPAGEMDTPTDTPDGKQKKNSKATPNVAGPHTRPHYKNLYTTSQLQLTEAKSTIVKQETKITSLTEENETLHKTITNLHGFLNSLAMTEGGVDVVQLLREKDYQNWKLREEIAKLREQQALAELRLVQREYQYHPPQQQPETPLWQLETPLQPETPLQDDEGPEIEEVEKQGGENRGGFAENA